jgi:hypothetical protein
MTAIHAPSSTYSYKSAATACSINYNSIFLTDSSTLGTKLHIASFPWHNKATGFIVWLEPPWLGT